MARIAQRDLALEWNVIDDEPDLARVHMMIENADDEDFMRKLEADRKGRRDDHPVRACWNTMLCGMVLGHRSTAEMPWELLRNPTLRRVVGIPVAAGLSGVPTKDAMCRFSKSLLRYPEETRAIREKMLLRLQMLTADKAYDDGTVYCYRLLDDRAVYSCFGGHV